MDQLERILDSMHKDPALTGYLLRRLLRSAPRTFQTRPRELARALGALEESDALALAERIARDEGIEALPFLVELLADDRASVRAKVVVMLARMPDARPITPILTGLLGQPEHPRVLSATLSALARIATDLPFGLVKPYLVHADARVRAAALELVLARDIADLEPVLTLMVNDTAGRVKALAAVGLWRMGRSDLLDLVREAEDPATRRALLYALGLAGRDPRALAILEEALDDPDEATRLVAVRTMGQVATGEDVGRLLSRAAQATGTRVREELSRLAFRIDPPRARASFYKLVHDAQERRDPRALSSILGLARGWPGLDPEKLLPLVEDSDGRVAANAVELLAPSILSPAVRHALRVALDSANPRVAATAAIPLWKSGESWPLHRLKELVTKAPPAFRASAAWALGQIGGFVAQSLLERSLADPDDGVRRSAHTALAAMS